MNRIPLGLWIAGCLILVRSVGGADGAAETTRMVSIEVVIAEFTQSGAPDDVGKFEIVENATARLKQLEKQGQLGAVARIHLTTLDRFPASVQIGERAPVATGRTVSQGGFRSERGGAPGGPSPVSAVYSVQNFGTIVSVTPTIEADGAVVLSLEAERSRLVPATPPAAGNAPNEARTVMVTAKTTVRVSPGQTVLVSGARTMGKDESGELLILASAHVSGLPKAKEGAAAAPNK